MVLGIFIPTHNCPRHPAPYSYPSLTLKSFLYIHLLSFIYQKINRKINRKFLHHNNRGGGFYKLNLPPPPLPTPTPFPSSPPPPTGCHKYPYLKYFEFFLFLNISASPLALNNFILLEK